MQYSSKNIMLALATGVGAFGGFPAAPPQLVELTKNEMVQWALIYVLLYQGGAKQDPKLAALITAVIFALHKALSN
jgi:hypothetical protein